MTSKCFQSLCVLFFSLVSVGAFAQEPPSVEDTLKKAKALAAELEYEQAVDLFVDVIADERSNDTQLVDANMQAGIIQRILDNDVDARLHFKYVLERDLNAQLPENMPPKITTFFELIRKEVSDSGVTISKGNPALFWSGAGLLGIGVVAVGIFTPINILNELSYLDKDLPTADRLAAQEVGPLYWAGFGVGAGVALVGGVLMIVGAE